MFSLFQALPISRQPACGKDVRRQLMWYNLDIQVGYKSLVNEQLACRNIKLIDDFVDEEGYFLSYEAFSARHPDCKVNYLVYMGWTKAIPGPWTQMLVACHSLTPEEREKEIDIEIKTKKVALSCVKPSFFNACCTPHREKYLHQ